MVQCDGFRAAVVCRAEERAPRAAIALDGEAPARLCLLFWAYGRGCHRLGQPLLQVSPHGERGDRTTTSPHSPHRLTSTALPHNSCSALSTANSDTQARWQKPQAIVLALANANHSPPQFLASPLALVPASTASQQQPWRTQAMARITSNHLSNSSNKHDHYEQEHYYDAIMMDEAARANILASCYTVDASSQMLQGFHYSTTGAGGAGWCV